MTDINNILINAIQWETENVTKPSILTGQLHNIQMMLRGIVVKKMSSNDELMGVIDRNVYSVDSHEIWTCEMIDISADDLEAMIGCVKRIIAEYTQVEGEETYLTWAGGEYFIWNNVRFGFSFAIMRMKSVQTEF